MTAVTQSLSHISPHTNIQSKKQTLHFGSLINEDTLPKDQSANTALNFSLFKLGSASIPQQSHYRV